MKKIGQYLLMFWLFGGGFVISLGCFIVSWKIALGVFCAWGCTWIASMIYWGFKARVLYLIEKEKSDKAKKDKTPPDSFAEAISRGLKEGSEEYARRHNKN